MSSLRIAIRNIHGDRLKAESCQVEDELKFKGAELKVQRKSATKLLGKAPLAKMRSVSVAFRSRLLTTKP